MAGVKLTPRQEEVLQLAAQGLTGTAIGRRLGISPKTVERHKTRMFAKLKVPNITAAVALYLRNGQDA